MAMTGCSADVENFVRIGMNKFVPAESVAPPPPGPCDGAKATNSPYADGTGDVATPYLICTAAQLNNIGLTSTDWSKSFKLLADIDMAAYTGTQYNMIGTSVTRFTGVFDGDNHTISNFTIAIDTSTGVGLFAFVGTGADIKKFKMTNVNVSASKTNVYIGPVVGDMSGGALSNVAVLSGTVAQPSMQITQRVGGAVGSVSSGGTLTGVVTGVTILGTSRAMYLGGVVGFADTSTLTSVGFTGQIATGAWVSYMGGIAGALNNGIVDSSYSTGDVNDQTCQAVGGAVGTMWGNSNILRSYATGNVIGFAFGTGGLVGELDSSAGYGIFNSYATGSVAGVFTRPRGALVGKVGGGNPSITNTYATGLVETAGTNNAGFVGDDTNGGGRFAVYTGNFWNNQVNSTLSGIFAGAMPAGLTGANTATLQTAATFTGAGWSTATWSLTPGQYPKLAWQP